MVVYTYFGLWRRQRGFLSEPAPGHNPLTSNESLSLDWLRTLQIPGYHQDKQVLIAIKLNNHHILFIFKQLLASVVTQYNVRVWSLRLLQKKLVTRVLHFFCNVNKPHYHMNINILLLYIHILRIDHFI